MGLQGPSTDLLFGDLFKRSLVRTFGERLLKRRGSMSVPVQGKCRLIADRLQTIVGR